MRILSIETSCDETAVSIVEAQGARETPTFRVLGNALYSQAKLHEKYGGVYPNLAKREHAKNLIPLLKIVLDEAGELKTENREDIAKEEIEAILSREEDLKRDFLELIPNIATPEIDAIAVTIGPGLEPALWVGVNFAKALSLAWNKPVIPVNHMEGHIASVLLGNKESKGLSYPLLSLLISGGHTQLVYAEESLSYKIIGDTRDDAVGEAFDKVARMLDLPYPGGPQISKLALADRQRRKKANKWDLPRPMINTPDYDFSFSGLKTAVLYRLRNALELDQISKEEIAREFEDAVTEVLLKKTERAITEYGIKTLIIAGGVAANTYIREAFKKLSSKYADLSVEIPENNLSTDNSIMIAMAAYLRPENQLLPENSSQIRSLTPNGNLSLE